MFIKNFDSLAKTPERKIILELVEAAFASIRPEEVFKKMIKRESDILTISDQSFNLASFERVFLLGFGKGSAGNTKKLESLVADRLTAGYVIDTVEAQFEKVEFTLGTHPLPSEENYNFTQKVMEKLGNLTERDLVLIVVCGGGSAMLVHPHAITLDQKISVGKKLLASGANIREMNTVRKHLSDVKGGGLAQILYPATIVTLVYSDVPGNDLATIASGPTIEDCSTIVDAQEILTKYNIQEDFLTNQAFVEKPHEKKYFERVTNTIVLSNKTALDAMKTKAEELGMKAEIFSDKFESDARVASKKLLDEARAGEILLAGGETTVHVNNKDGVGGRNQVLVLASLELLGENTTICSFDSDGWDFVDNAGAIGDHITVARAKELGIDPKSYLDSDNSLDFFNKVGDAIVTGRLASNVSDLMIVLRK